MKYPVPKARSELSFRITCILLLLAVCARAQTTNSDPAWDTYGGDAGGQRYSSAAQINRSNLSQLGVAWTFHTGDITPATAFEATPILFKGSLYFASPLDQVFALDPTTGAKRWSYNPHLDTTRDLGIVASRGVASWSASPGGPVAPQTPCADRIFIGTLDARLIALDASSGRLCADFGHDGTVDLTQGVDYRKGDDYAITSPPTVIGDVVVVGSGVADNLRVDVERGDVRGFDVRTGRLLWTWQPIPWANQQKLRTGAANTWSIIAADPEHGLIYLPTSSPSPDYYGGLRPGDDRDADSIVALDARTGKKVWAYQIVHHNIWDYDLAAEPLLFTFRGKIPAVAVSTKMGMVFVFNRLTGEPLYPIHERPVPQSDIPGEVTSPTQPFSDLPPLSPLALDLTKPLGIAPADDARCRTILSHLRNQGIYTPVSFQGSLLFPSNVGGVNWGSTAFDPASGILYANTNRTPFIIQLQKRPRFTLANRGFRIFLGIAAVALFLLTLLLLDLVWRRKRGAGLAVAFAVLAVLVASAAGFGLAIKRHISNRPWLSTGVFAAHFGKEYGQDIGVPYVLLRQPLQSEPGRPCSPIPWGTVSALNLNTGTTAWQTPLGTRVAGQETGTMNVGGPMVTAGGLVFTAASAEPLLRAFDAATGQQLWTGQLPVPAQATPMTYMARGMQFVVVAAGGHGALGTEGSDTLVAFALHPVR